MKTFPGFVLAVLLASSARAVDFSSIYGGSTEEMFRDVVIHSDGSVYMTGGSKSNNFPVTAGAYDISFNGNMDVVLVKFDASGVRQWATLLGGVNYDRAYAVEVDESGVYVAGRCGNGFPTTTGVIQRTFAGDNAPNQAYGQQDGFAAKFSHSGQLIWSTYVGCPGMGFARDAKIAPDGLLLAMSNIAPNFQHVTVGAYQTAHGGNYDGAVVKLSLDATQVLWGTYFGGPANDGSIGSVGIDATGKVYFGSQSTGLGTPVTAGLRGYSGGMDQHVACFSADGTSLVYATYLGGGSTDGMEAHNLTVAPDGTAYFCGASLSTDYPVTPGAYDTSFNGPIDPVTGHGVANTGDVVACKLNTDGTIVAATYIGGISWELCEGCTISGDRLYISASTKSSNFPTVNALDSSFNGNMDFVAVILSSDLSTLQLSTFWGAGGTDNSRASDFRDGYFAIAGQTSNSSFPQHNPFQTVFGGGNWDCAAMWWRP